MAWSASRPTPSGVTRPEPVLRGDQVRGSLNVAVPTSADQMIVVTIAPDEFALRWHFRFFIHPIVPSRSRATVRSPVAVLLPYGQISAAECPR